MRTTSEAARLARFIWQSGLTELGLGLHAPHVAAVAVRHGLSLRSVHALHAASTPHRVALVDDDIALTYVEVDARINQICRALDAAGVRRGDRMVLCLENRVEYVLFWFAAFRAGVSVVHASYRSTADELDFLLDHSAAAAVVSSPRTSESVAQAVATRDVLVIAVGDAAVCPRQKSYPAFASGFDTSFFARGKHAAQDNVVYTSGTTGRPKGAVRDFNSMGLVELSRIGVALPVRAGQRHLVVGPLYHSAPQAFVAMMTSLGCTIYLRPRFDAEDTLACLSRWQIHSTFMVPTMIRRVLSLPKQVQRAHPTPALTALVSGAAAFPHSLRVRAAKRFGAETVFDFYGATELGWVTLVRGDEMLAKPGSVGRALEGHELQVRSDGRTLPPGEIGKIWARNPQTMQGYLDDAAATDAARDGGWMTVDDLGHLDDDGHLFLAGRDRDMVISGGVNIYPVEIEEVLSAHPDVAEVAVIGLPDDDLGEQLAGIFAGTATPEALEAFCRERLAAHKVPRRWVCVDELPRNPTGKVLKRDLRERLT